MLITMYVTQSVRLRLFFFILLATVTVTSAFSQLQRITGEKIPIVHLDNLVQGRVYFSLYPRIEGSQYLLNEWSLGNIRMQNRGYQEVPLLYDIYSDDLILLHLQENSFNLIKLVKEYIQGFSLGDRRFINLTYSLYNETGLKMGFYELLYEADISFLSKRRYLLKTENAISSFDRKDLKYLIKEGQGYRITNKRSLIAAMGESRKKTIYSFLKKQKIFLKKANDQQLVQLAKYLNTLQ